MCLDVFIYQELQKFHRHPQQPGADSWGEGKYKRAGKKLVYKSSFSHDFYSACLVFLPSPLSALGFQGCFAVERLVPAFCVLHFSRLQGPPIVSS